MAAIAAALGVPERGERLVALLRQRLASLAALTAPLSSGAPRVAHVEWMAPLMGSGYWIAQCMEAAGCAMVHGSKGGHSQVLLYLPSPAPTLTPTPTPTPNPTPPPNPTPTLNP